MFFTALLCLIPVFYSTVCSASAASGDQNGETLIVGVPTDRCPVFYQDKDTGEITGIGVELMRMAAENAGYHASFQAIGEESVKSVLDNKQYDIILPFGSAVSSTASAPAIVSENLFQPPFTLVTQNNSQLPRLNEWLYHQKRLITIASQAKMLYNRYRTGGMTYGSKSG